MTGAHSPAGGAALEPALEKTMREIGIPPRPCILERLHAQMASEEPDFRQLAALIGADVGLSAGLLKVANSAYFGFQGHARTVSQALTMLGLEVTAHAVAGLILRKVFAGIVHLDRFWDASAGIACASGWLAGELGVRDGVRVEDAYTYGLFRDCGVPVLMRRFPDYVAVLRRANEEGQQSFTAVEMATLPTHHALVGGLMAQSWWLPEDTCLAIRNHHDAAALAAPDCALPRASIRLAAIGQLAEHVFQRVTGLSPGREWEKLAATCRRHLELQADDVERLVQSAVPVIADRIH